MKHALFLNVWRMEVFSVFPSQSSAALDIMHLGITLDDLLMDDPKQN